MNSDRRCRTVWGLGAVLGLAAVAFAVPVEGEPGDEPDPGRPGLAATPADIAGLVAKLGADDWRVRDRAMRDLVAVGDPARKALQNALAHPDAEVRWRASYALARIDVDFRPLEVDPARELYRSAAEARAQADGLGAARRLYGEVIERFPDTRWAGAARERLATLEDPPAPPPAAEEEAIARLVAQLGAQDWAERQDASRRLAALGAAARPALEAAAGSPDPEIGWRVRRLLERLEPRGPVAEPDLPELHIVAEPMRLRRIDSALRRFDPPIAATTHDGLVSALGSEDVRQVGLARRLLQQIGPDAVGALVRGLDDAPEVATVEIMDILRRITRQKLGFRPEAWRAWWREHGGPGP
jgi:hypothetical protein